MKNIVKDMQAELYVVQPVDVPERQREGQQSWLPPETLPTSLLLWKKKSLILLGKMCVKFVHDFEMAMKLTFITEH